jgi:hypothetical protein
MFKAVKNNDSEWVGEGSMQGYVIKKRPLGRGRFAFHVYRLTVYVAYTTNYADAVTAAANNKAKLGFVE